MKRNDIVQIQKPHPWCGGRGVITEGPLGDDKIYGVIVRKDDNSSQYLSIPETLLKVI